MQVSGPGTLAQSIGGRYPLACLWLIALLDASAGLVAHCARCKGMWVEDDEAVCKEWLTNECVEAKE